MSLGGWLQEQLFERRITTQAGHTLRDQVVEVTKAGGVFHVRTQHHGVQISTAVIVATGATPIRLDVPGAQERLDRLRAGASVMDLYEGDVPT